MKICSKCKEEKSNSEFGKDLSKSCGLQSYCKECQKNDRIMKTYSSSTISVEYRQTYYKENKKELLTKQKIYKENNKEVINNYQKEYRKKRRSEDITFRLSEVIRSNVSRVFKYIGTKKETKSYSIVEYKPIELKEHLESKFKEGMTWDNYGTIWEIDHTIPVKWFINNIDKFKDKNHVCKEANALNNLTPMFFNDNRTKGSTY